MRTRPDHREALARRLDLLRAELDADGVPPVDDERPWWETAPVLPLTAPVEAGGEVPVVPVPGRHAARRRASSAGWLQRTRDVLPEPLKAAAGIGPWHLTVLALLVAAGLALTTWWVLRGDPSVATVSGGPASPLVPVSAAPSGVPSPGAATATAARTPTVTVDVVGKVRHPRVVDLPAGSRVLDAIQAAGGARPGADLTRLNRARVLVDGEQVVVGVPAAPAASGTSPGSGASGAGAGAVPGGPTGLVDLNTATVEELDTLPEVGPVTAEAILDYRAEHGGFGSVDELLDIEGIGEKTLAKIAPHVTV
jgi:competence protein ComEA